MNESQTFNSGAATSGQIAEGLSLHTIKVNCSEIIFETKEAKPLYVLFCTNSYVF